MIINKVKRLRNLNYRVIKILKMYCKFFLLSIQISNMYDNIPVSWRLRISNHDNVCCLFTLYKLIKIIPFHLTILILTFHCIMVRYVSLTKLIFNDRNFDKLKLLEQLVDIDNLQPLLYLSEKLTKSMKTTHKSYIQLLLQIPCRVLCYLGKAVVIQLQILTSTRIQLLLN